MLLQHSSQIHSVCPHVPMDISGIFRAEPAENVILDAPNAPVSEIALLANTISTSYRSTTTNTLHVFLSVPLVSMLTETMYAKDASRIARVAMAHQNTSA